ncbi:peptidylprolyl isomerase [Caulobacter endophyticus]|uniref:peptidylprolyl isomerase n=1 Tax=Caulobacter endophyticus TaxID=2172652 RepID=UPI00240F286E|nr:peptidylprolyl isomerase [Caulobacter endophyticus]MDG2527175.1 SurA N-terminal domain-containing protein [Caulobacter endophyticus]
MLAGFRSFAKSPFAIVLFGLLIVSFAVFGISDVFSQPSSSKVIVVGSRSLSPEDFKARFDNYREQMQKQGETLTPDGAVAAGVDRGMLQELALQESMAELIKKMGVRPSEALVGEVLHKQLSALPAGVRPFDPVTGKFDKQMYQALLAQNNLTPASYEASLRDEIAQSQYFASVANGLRTPRIYSALQAVYGYENRDLSAFLLTPANVAQPALPTDAQLQAFMTENAARLTLPETRVLSVVRFSAKALESSVTVDPAEVQKTFDFRKDTLAQPETRSLVQIVAPDAKAAAAIAERLRKGEAPADVAKAYGKQPVMILDKPKTALPDRKVADAAFGLGEGQVSAPIAGELGQSVIKVLKINAAKAASLEAARPQIEADLRVQAAQTKAYDQTQAFQDARDAGANVVDAAGKAGALVVTTAPLTAQGTDLGGQPAAGLTPDVLKAAFALPAGGESELIEAGKGEYFAVRVEKVNKAALPPLAEVKPMLTQQWMLNEMVKRLKAKADELVARVRKGESIDAVAASVNTKVEKVAGLSRENAQQHQALGRDLLIASFNAKPGETFAARAPQIGYFVGRIDTVRPGDTAEIARAAEGMRPQTSMAYMRDIGQAGRAAARDKLKPKLNLNLARQAIGVDTEALAKAEKDAGAKGGAKKAAAQ